MGMAASLRHCRHTQRASTPAARHLETAAKENTMTDFYVCIIDHPPMCESELFDAECAAERALTNIPTWILEEAQKDHFEMLENGLKRAEHGNSLWQQIENLAFSAVHKTLKMENWWKQPEEMHIEIHFY